MSAEYKKGSEIGESGDSLPFAVTRITSGLAFGEGAISNHIDNEHILTIVDDTILHSPDIIVPIDIDDDGCSDGRKAIQIYDQHTQFKRSLNRAKIFGGAVTMTAASLIGVGASSDKKLQAVFDESIDILDQHGINFGAHTDEHAQGNDCGCGAIDRARETLVAVLKYESRIREVIAILGIDSKGLEDVYASYRDYMRNQMSQVQDYSGKKIIEHILATNKVIKKLHGKHREHGIVMNEVESYTVNQELIREVTDEKAQVFGIDIWRLNVINANVYFGQSKLQNKALLSQIMYTLGTAAVLTKGDLPVYRIQTLA